MATKNDISVCGIACDLPEIIPSSFSTYSFHIRVERNSGTFDILPVRIPKDVGCMIRPGDKYVILGKVESENEIVDNRSKLRVFITPYSISQVSLSVPYHNNATIEGTICKPPTYRVTPLGKDICDLLLAVPRYYDKLNKSEYIPCLFWRENAKIVGGYVVGDVLSLSGRFQSREYVKVLDAEKDIRETRIVYEISAANVTRVYSVCNN